MSRLALVIFVFLLIFSHAIHSEPTKDESINQLISACRGFVPSIPRELATCQWYNPNSCCSIDTSKKIKQGWESQTGRNSGSSNVTVPQFLVEAFAGGCLDELHQYICYLCSPGQTNFIEEKIQLLGQRSILYLCSSFCDRLYNKCALVPVTNNRPVITAYGSGKEFCESGLNDPANQLQIKVRDANCFNNANILNISFLAIIALCSMLLVAF